MYKKIIPEKTASKKVVFFFSPELNAKLTLALLTPAISSLENSVDPDQLADWDPHGFPL